MVILEGAKTVLSHFDREFFNVNQPLLFKIIMVANWFNIESLLDKAAKFIAEMIENKPIHKIIVAFDILPDMTYAEQAVCFLILTLIKYFSC